MQSTPILWPAIIHGACMTEICDAVQEHTVNRSMSCTLTRHGRLTLIVGPFETVKRMIPMRITDISISMVALRPIQSPIKPKQSCPMRMPINCKYVVAWVQTCTVQPESSCRLIYLVHTVASVFSRVQSSSCAEFVTCNQNLTSLQSLNLLQQLGYACLKRTLLLLIEKICTPDGSSNFYMIGGR